MGGGGGVGQSYGESLLLETGPRERVGGRGEADTPTGGVLPCSPSKCRAPHYSSTRVGKGHKRQGLASVLGSCLSQPLTPAYGLNTWEFLISEEERATDFFFPRRQKWMEERRGLLRWARTAPEPHPHSPGGP